MKIFVAGHNGLVGSAIVKKLKAKLRDLETTVELLKKELTELKEAK